MSTPEFSEEELRALEAEMDKITVDDVLLQTVVSLINLGARKIGAEQPDLEQTRQAIEGARALMPLLEPRHAEQLGQVREALSRLQMAYVQRSGGGAAPSGEQPERKPEQEGTEGPGPAQRSGRLWVPGQ